MTDQFNNQTVAFDKLLACNIEVSSALVEFHHQVWQQAHIPNNTLELCRLRIAQLHCCPVELNVHFIKADLSLEQHQELQDWPKSNHYSNNEKACLEIAELYVMDPSMISDEQANRVISSFGDAGFVALLEALGMFDGFCRFKLMINCGPASKDLGYVSNIANDQDTRVGSEKLATNKSSSGNMRVKAKSTNTGSLIRDSALNLVPDTLEAFLALYDALWHKADMRPAELEIARLRNASIINCSFCKATRFDIAQTDGLDEARASAAVQAGSINDLKPRDKLIIIFTEQFLYEPAIMNINLQKQMSENFSKEELISLSCAIAVFMCFSKLAVSLGGLPDKLPIMVSSIPA